MKSTGMIRKIDELGRIVVPKEIRKTLDIDNGDPLEIFVEGDHIILKKHNPACLFCGKAEDVIFFRGKLCCRDCLEELAHQL